MQLPRSSLVGQTLTYTRGLAASESLRQLLFLLEVNFLECKCIYLPSRFLLLPTFLPTYLPTYLPT